MKVNLPKIIILQNSGAATIDPLSFVLHQIDSKSLNLGLILSMKYFDRILTDQLNQVSNNIRPSNELSDIDSAGHPNSATLFDINEIYGMYI